MPSIDMKTKLLGNALMREIAAIRLDTLWKMLALRKEGRLPEVEEEGATGVFDNKGAMFVPGGFIHGDSDGRPVTKDRYKGLTEADFRRTIREYMRFDNATLLFEDGVGGGVNLDNGFFSSIAGNSLALAQAVGIRNPLIRHNPPEKITSRHITRSYCPTRMSPPYGSRTKLSSCLGVCMIHPGMYFVQCRTELGLRGGEEKKFWEGIRAARRPIMGKNNETLAGPFVVVLHTTRYRKEILTGLTRIIGWGRFGEFATFTLEEASNDLLNEVNPDAELDPQDVFAEYEGSKIVGIIRFFPKTTPGKRLQRTNAVLVSPIRDLNLDLETITNEARERYNVE